MATHWNPAAVRAAHGLRVTAPERRRIVEKLPLASDYRPYVDAVFSGGGVRCLAFLGAMRCLDDVGIRVRKVGGTSAGSVCAAAVAAQLPMDLAEQRIGALDFETLLTSRCGDSARALDNLAGLLLTLELTRRTGRHSSAPMRSWIRELLRGHPDTFPLRGSAGWHTERELRVVVSDISAGEMRILPDDLHLYGEDPATFSVAEAVALSMSIPLFFEPGSLGPDGNTIVDGGILSNFPVWIFDKPVCDRPRCPTLGFQLQSDDAHRKVVSALDMVSAIVQTMRDAGDLHYLKHNDDGRIVSIRCPSVSATDFALTAADKDELYAAGYACTKRFLLDEWDWDAHLAARGVVSK